MENTHHKEDIEKENEKGDTTYHEEEYDYKMCISPLTTQNGSHSCGQCRQCLIKKSQEWALRCDWENKQHKSGAFITLTYSDDNIPIRLNKELYRVPTLKKKHFQDFMKRLRKKQEKYSDKKIRYFACGEYGEQTSRPHYHALVWGIHNQVKKEMETIWPYGFVKVGDIEVKSIRYVTNYMMKKGIEPPRGAEKYFTLMSRKPGIGNNYIDKNKAFHSYHEQYRSLQAKPAEQRRYLPKYYQDKIFTPEQKILINQDKEKEFLKYQAEIDLEVKDILDPIGYLREKQKNKEQAEIRKQKFQSLNKKRI